MKTIITIVLLWVTNYAFAQEYIKDYTLSNFTEIKSIDPNETDYGDLTIIGNAIGSSKIVMLGEQDHGDASTFYAKTRLIKYLHEKKGFDVLVFESDFWGLHEVWQNVSEGKMNADSIRTNTYGIWSNCLEVQGLYNYIKSALQSPHPLIVNGMDCRHSLHFSMTNYVRYFDSIIIPQTTLTTADRNRFIAILKQLIDKEYKSDINKKNKALFFTSLNKIKEDIPALDKFWTQEIENITNAAKFTWNFNFKNPTRDQQMASNLKWICDVEYPGKKVIVWAHSYHITKNITVIKDKMLAPYSSTLGNETYMHYKDSVYIMGFTSYSGMAGRIGAEPYKIDEPKEACFEKWAHATNKPYGFINFRNCSNKEPFNMKGLNHEEFSADWTKVFDGVFYIQDMKQCVNIKK